MALAAEVLTLWDADSYGETDRLLEAAGPALGPEGRAELHRLLQARLAALPRLRKETAFKGWKGRASWRSCRPWASSNPGFRPVPSASSRCLAPCLPAENI